MDKSDGWYCELGPMRFLDRHLLSNEQLPSYEAYLKA